MSNQIETKKSLGQHWLHDEQSLKTICGLGKILPTDTVLEIGPGTGNLTQHLVKLAQKVIAVEFDQILATRLPERVKAKNLQVVQSDILKFDLTTLPSNYKVIANIPYYLTSNLVRVLSESTNRADKVVMLIQKEVAQRVAAKPGDMSLLSVSAQYYWDVSLGIQVPAEMFTPKPKVDSQVIILNRSPNPKYTDVDDKKFFQLVKSGFASRRKTLINSLSGGLRIDKAQINELLHKANIDPSVRPQVLSVNEWHKLYSIANESNLI